MSNRHNQQLAKLSGRNNDEYDTSWMDLASDDEAELFGALPGPRSPRKALMDGLDKPDNAIEEVIKMLKMRRKPAELNNDQCEQRLAALINVMREAEQDDEIAHKQDKPCLYKLKSFAILQDAMSRPELRDGFVVAGGVDCLNQWITPLEDGTKPNNTIMIGVLKLLKQLPVSSVHIKTSNIGKTIAHIFKDSKNSLEIRRLAEDLISHWLRPMLGLNSSYSVMIEQNQEALRHGMSPTAVVDGGLSPRAGGISPSMFGMSPVTGTSADNKGTKRFRPQPLAEAPKERFYTNVAKTPRTASPTSSKMSRGRAGEDDNSPGSTGRSADSATRAAIVKEMVESSSRRATQLQKISNNFVALPDYEHIKYKRLSKRATLEKANKNTRKNRLIKSMAKNKVKTELDRPHRRDKVEVAYLKKGANIKDGGF